MAFGAPLSLARGLDSAVLTLSKPVNKLLCRKAVPKQGGK